MFLLKKLNSKPDGKLDNVETVGTAGTGTEIRTPKVNHQVVNHNVHTSFS